MVKPLGAAALLAPMLISALPAIAAEDPVLVVDPIENILPPAGFDASFDTIPVHTVDDQPSTTSAPRTYNRVIEEIVVTAQKREERLQDVPISIQAFGGDGLAARGVRETVQLGQVVPSLQFSNVAGFTLIFMRGIGTDNFVPSADPSIATYIDGVYMPAGPGATTSLANVERVEVLKGPQGTLFGRNATGGAISITTEKPGPALTASAEAEIGNFNARSLKASVSGGLTDWLSAGFSGVVSAHDSIYTNRNYETPSDRLRAGRLKLSFDPHDDLSLSLSAYYSEQEGLGSVIGKNTRPAPLFNLLIPAQPDDYQAISDFPAQSRVVQDLRYGDLTWKRPGVDVKLLASDISLTTEVSSVDFDGSPLPIAAFETTNSYTDQQTAELQFVSTDESWGADRFKWVTGLYYLRSDAGFDPAYLFAAPRLLNDLSTQVERLIGIGIPSALLDLLSGLPAVGEDGVRLIFAGRLGTRSYSAYVQGTLLLTDTMDLTLGGRYQREERFMTKASTRLIEAETPLQINFPLEDRTDSSFSPRIALSLRVVDDVLIYASYSVGYKSGTYNIINIYTPPDSIEPERVTSYELGTKLEFMQGSLRLNGAVFYNDIENLQSGFVSLLAGGAVRFLNIAGARTHGAEIDGTWVPFANLNPGLVLTGNAAYVDALYTDFTNGEGFNPTTGLYQRNQNFEGNRMVRTPRISAGVGIVQMLQTEHGEYELALDQYYNSGYFYDTANTVEERAYRTLGARISYLYLPWNLRVTLFGLNLLDERYHIQQLQTDFGVISTLAAPREYGLRLSWTF